MRQLNRAFSFAGLAMAIAFSLTASAADEFQITRVTDGDDCTLNLDSQSGQNRISTSSLLSQVFYEKSGTLKLTGSGATATVYTTPVATNGTLTVDVSGFEFSDSANKTLQFAGGLVCDTTGSLVVSGVNSVILGGTDESMPVSVRNVTLNGADLSFGTKFTAWVLPDRTQTAWSLDVTNRSVRLMGANVLGDLVDENHELAWHGNLSLYGDGTIAEGDTLVSSFSSSSPAAVSFYPGYSPTAKYENETYTRYNSFWGRARTTRGNIRVPNTATVNLSVRYAKMYGSVEAGYLTAVGTKATSADDAFDFYGPVEIKKDIKLQGASGAGQWLRFFGVCFTDGVQTLNFSSNESGTNNTLFIVKKEGVDYMPKFNAVKFAAEQDMYTHHSALVISNLTVKIGTISQGVGVVRGNGTVMLGGITAGAKLMVEPGITVVKDTDVAGVWCARVDAERKDGKEYKTYFCPPETDGTLDLSTYEGSGTITPCAGMTVYGATADVPSVSVDPAGQEISVRTRGDTWNDNTRITHWYDFSDFSTMTQVVATAEPPTSDGAAGKRVLTGDELGPKGVVLGKPVNNVNYAAVEAVVDKRGAGYPSLVNLRMYSNTQSKGTNEWWSSVYMGYVTNYQGRSYVSPGTSTGRRLTTAGDSSKWSSWRSITMVFGSQNGGGAALLALKNTGALGRTKGLENPIASNNVYRIYVDGTEVVPNEAYFSGDWQVITIQRTNDVSNLIYGIGYSAAYTGTGVADGGGQNYGEMVIYKELPSEAERIELERYLAKKWNIAYSAPVSKVSLAGTGVLNVSGENELYGTFSGTNVLNDADVTFASTGNPLVKGSGRVTASTRANVPLFDPDFTGTVQLGANAWQFTVTPETGKVENKIDIGQAKFYIPESAITVGITVNGSLSSASPFTLVSGGGFEGTPTWSASLAPSQFAEQSANVIFNQTATELQATLPHNYGLFLFFW